MSCKSISDFPYEDLRSGDSKSFDLDEKSPVFAFETGKSYFKAFRLPPYASSYRIVLRSYMLGEEIKSAYIFCPRVIFLNEKFETVRSTDDYYLRTMKTGFLEASRETWGIMFKLEGEITVAEANRDDRYMVVYTTEKLLGSRTSIPTWASLPIIFPGIVASIPLYKEEEFVPHSPVGRINISVGDEPVGVPKDNTEGGRYREAAERGNAQAQYDLGRMYENGENVKQDYIDAARWYRKAADQGFAKAQFRLAYLCHYGHGISQDYTEAVKWYRLAAEQDFALAQNNLGFLYQYGFGVPRDFAEAVMWYRRAAEQDNARSQCNLGLIYQKGEGVPQDFVLAYMWFDLAASKDFEADVRKRAAKERDLVASKMTPAQIAEAQRLVREWKPKVRQQ